MDPNKRHLDGTTALMLAARFGYTEIARSLVGRGAKVEAMNKDGLSALILAAVGGHKEGLERSNLSRLIKRLGLR